MTVTGNTLYLPAVRPKRPAFEPVIPQRRLGAKKRTTSQRVYRIPASHHRPVNHASTDLYGAVSWDHRGSLIDLYA